MPSAVRQVVTAFVCWLGRTPAPLNVKADGEIRRAWTVIETGSLQTMPGGRVVSDAPPKVSGRFDPPRALPLELAAHERPSGRHWFGSVGVVEADANGVAGVVTLAIMRSVAFVIRSSPNVCWRCSTP